MSDLRGRGPRAKFSFVTIAALVIAAAIAVPFALANTATPTTSHATWSYVSGNSGAVKVVVTGDWNWVSQSCASGGSVSSTDVNGHYAIGYAGSWNDSTTPNTLTGKATNGTPVTLHVGNSMDQVIVNFCRGTTTSNPYPTGTYSISHEYASLADFRADVPNGVVCVNAYDIHKSDQTSDDWNPGKNGDNTLKANQYVTSTDCVTAAQAVKPAPALTLVKLERIGNSGDYVRGPVAGKPGETVEYEMVVKNTGNVSLVITLSDPHCDSGTIAPSGSVTLGAGATETYTCAHTLTSSDVPSYVNTATASGKSASASSSVTATSSVTANVGAGAVKGKVKKVRKPAKPAKPAVKAATFTG